MGVLGGQGLSELTIELSHEPPVVVGIGGVPFPRVPSQMSVEGFGGLFPLVVRGGGAKTMSETLTWATPSDEVLPEIDDLPHDSIQGQFSQDDAEDTEHDGVSEQGVGEAGSSGGRGNRGPDGGF